MRVMRHANHLLLPHLHKTLQIAPAQMKGIDHPILPRAIRIRPLRTDRRRGEIPSHLFPARHAFDYLALRCGHIGGRCAVGDEKQVGRTGERDDSMDHGFHFRHFFHGGPKGVEAVARARIPDFNGAVAAAGEDPAAVLREADAVDEGGVASEFLKERRREGGRGVSVD